MNIHHYTGENTEQYREQYLKNPAALLTIDAEEAEHLTGKIASFYQTHLQEAGMDGYVVGISGGIDSATIAHLLVNAVGSAQVYGVILPARHTRDTDIEHAETVADTLGIETNDHDTFRERIDTIVDEAAAVAADGAAADKVRRGNLLARIRMSVIRDHAKHRNALVAGTTNASERDLGYMTLAGDGKGGIDNEALYTIYKTTERSLATHLGVPQKIIEKQPTADLWQDQTDADELGFSYETVDQVLVGLQLGVEHQKIAAATTVSAHQVAEIADRVDRMRFKRELAPHPTFS